MKKDYIRRADTLNGNLPTQYGRSDEQENAQTNIIEDFQGQAQQSTGPGPGAISQNMNQASLDNQIDDTQFEYLQNDSKQSKFKDFSKTKVNELGSLGTLKNLSKILNQQQEYHMKRQNISGRNGQPSQSQPGNVKQIMNGKIVCQKSKENLNDLLNVDRQQKSTSQLMKRKQVLQDESTTQQIEIKKNGYRQILQSRERLDKLEQMNQSLMNLLSKSTKTGKKSSHQVKQSQTIDWNQNANIQIHDKFDQLSTNQLKQNDKLLSVTMGPEGFRQASKDGKPNSKS